MVCVNKKMPSIIRLPYDLVVYIYPTFVLRLLCVFILI